MLLCGAAAGVFPPACSIGPCLFPRHLQFTSSSFSFWSEDFCLGSCPDLPFKQSAEAALSEEVLHISGRLRDVCCRQGLVCWCHWSLPHAIHIIQVSPLLSALACSCTCYFQIGSHVPPLSLLPPLSLFFPLRFNERPTSRGNPSPPVTAAAKVKPGAGIVHKCRHRGKGRKEQ